MTTVGEDGKAVNLLSEKVDIEWIFGSSAKS
jgi:hypothetical protein